MAFDLPTLFSLFLMTVGYWLADRMVRQDGLLRLVEALGAPPPGAFVLLAAPVLALAPYASWGALPGGDAVRWTAVAIACALAWKASTKDIDVVTGERHTGQRWSVVAAAAGSAWSPALLPLVAVLLSKPFGMWEHHATLPMRALQAILAWLGLRLAGWEIPVGLLYWFLLTIQVSHYLITAIAKVWLGPGPINWVWENKLSHLAANAWGWGWARFVPWPAWRRVVRTAERFERPAQAYAFGIELLAPLALLHPLAGVGFCVGWSAFHAGVFALSGLLFWDWIAANLAIGAGMAMLPAAELAPFFGWMALAWSVLYMLAFPLRHKLWRPMPLGWWDTPFTQRMHWLVTGASGRVYGVYADFMCPHERLFGKVHACFLAPDKVMTYHLGEIWKRELRDALRAAGPDRERLDAVRARYGLQPRDERMAAEHVQWLRRFFHEINAGSPKHVLPWGLRWLKAPGGQIFHWGDWPKFWAQEAVTEVELRYREQYFDGRDLITVREETVLRIPIDGSAAAAPRLKAPTPKQIDDLLLEHAAGKLVDLPSWSGGYVQADDGKA